MARFLLTAEGCCPTTRRDEQHGERSRGDPQHKRDAGSCCLTAYDTGWFQKDRNHPGRLGVRLGPAQCLRLLGLRVQGFRVRSVMYCFERPKSTQRQSGTERPPTPTNVKVRRSVNGPKSAGGEGGEDFEEGNSGVP